MQIALFLGLLIGMSSAAPSPILRVKEIHYPIYPQTARLAKITGSVTIEFTIAADGTNQLHKAVGHPLLVKAASESLSLSKFGCEHCDGTTNFSLTVDFEIRDFEDRDSENVLPEAGRSSDLVHITVTAHELVLIGPVVTTLTKEVRSIRCFYLWKCRYVSHRVVTK